MKFPKHNPFAQPQSCWQITYTVPLNAVIAVEDAFADVALSTASFEQPHDHSQWTVEIITERQLQPEELERRVASLERALKIELPPPDTAKMEPSDWQQHLVRDFPAQVIGRFFVHGAHARDFRPAHLKPVQVEAGMAFGSGEHATTSGCLLALHRLAKRRRFKHVLDMGCGSGILAIAAARCWPKAGIMAVDVDPVSAHIANDNMRINAVRRQVRVLAGNGYANRLVRRAAPYDIIVANILARPLVALSPALARALRPGGVAVLSGLLATQEPMVLAAHRRQGMKLKRRIVRQGWSTLVLEK